MAAASSARPRSETARPSFDSVDEFVAASGGIRAIHKVLIANNGIAAVKCMRSVRTWAYETFGDDRAVRFTVMTTPEDLRANAEYVRMADEVIEVPGGANNNNFANVRLICELAETCRADAVWAGWGHASENPALPDGLRDRGIAFIGPPSGPMRALGDKIGSTIIAQSAGVPTIAWNGASIRVDYKATGLSDEVYAQANVKTAEQAERVAPDVGFPLMVKASEGGGGKGIRKVEDLEGLAAAFRQVQGEVPGSPIFLMRLASRARHLEVQLLADEYGEAISLSGRDCSVQRRHQKIVEEGPPVAADPHVWREMERAAVRLAKEVGYVNAGTVEYLYTEHPPEGAATKFAFLELNPRLQVEHPVTEMITGVNLPAAQLQVAMGLPLHRIADVRKLFGASATGSEPINFDETEQVPPLGHVIASRITAENPDSGFQPTSGAITELNFRSTPNVWGYFSVDSSGRVHEYADSQIGHLFGFGPSREAARRNMVLALRELSIRGDIRTTVEYLAHMMESRDFRRNAIDTQWLDRRITANVGVGKPPATFVALIGGVVRCHVTVTSRAREFCAQLERGQCPSPSLLSVEDEVKMVYEGVRYTMQVAQAGENLIVVSCNGVYVMVEARALSDGGLLVLLNGRSHVVYWKEEATGLRVALDGATCVFTAESDPSKLLADVSGKLVRFLVEDGAHVDKGQGYAEVEVMKMYMPLLAPEAGVLRHVQPEGAILEAGALIGRLDLDDPSRVPQAEPFKGTLAGAGPAPAGVQAAAEAAAAAAAGTSASSGGAAAPAPASSSAGEHSAAHSTGSSPGASPAEAAPTASRRAHTVTRSAERTLRSVLSGFVVPSEVFEAAVSDFDQAWRNEHLPLLELEEQHAVLAARLPGTLGADLARIIASHRDAIGARRPSLLADDAALAAAADGALAGAASSPQERPAFLANDELDLRPVRDAVQAALAAVPAGRERTTAAATAKPILDLCSKYAEGVRGARRAALCDLLAVYSEVERLFGGGTEGRRREDVLMELRAANMDADRGAAALAPVYATVRAHEHVRERNVLVLRLLRRVAAEIEEDKNAAALSASALAAAAQEAGTATAGGPSSVDASSGVVGGEGPGSRGVSPGPNAADLDGSVGLGLDADQLISSALSIADNISDAGRSDADSGRGTEAASQAASGGAAAAASQAASAAPTTGAWDREEALLYTLAELRGAAFAEVTLEARQLLILARQPSARQRVAAIETVLRTIAAAGDSRRSARRPGVADHPVIAEEDGTADDATVPPADDVAPPAYPASASASARASSQMRGLVRAELSLVDVLMRFFGHEDEALRRAAVEVHVRRLYRAYAIRSITFPDAEAEAEAEAGAEAGAGAGAEAAASPALLEAVFRFSSSGSASDELAPDARFGGGIGSSFGSGPSSGASGGSGGGMRKSGSLGGGKRSLLYAAGAADSVDNLQALSKRATASGASRSGAADGASPPPHADGGSSLGASQRVGIFAVFANADALAAGAARLAALVRRSGGGSGGPAGAVHVIHVAVLTRPRKPDQPAAETDDAECSAVLSAAVAPQMAALTAAGVRRVTVLVPPDSSSAASQRAHMALPSHAGAAAPGHAALRSSTSVHASAEGGAAPAGRHGSSGGARVASDLPGSVVPACIGGVCGNAGMVGDDGPVAMAAAAAAAAARDDASSGDASDVPPTHPCAFTLRGSAGFTEDERVRHLEPPLSGYLELNRLSNFSVQLVPTPNRAVHVYEARPSGAKASAGRGGPRSRFFVRAIVRHTERLPTLDSVLEQFPGPERMFVESLNALGVAMGGAAKAGASGMAVGNNHVFLNVLPTASVHPEYVVSVIRTLARRYADRLRVLRVASVEFRILTRLRPTAQPLALRLLCSNPTGYVLRVDAYVEVRDDRRPDAEPVLASIPTTGPDSVVMGSYGGDPADMAAARAAVHAQATEAVRASGGSAAWPAASVGAFSTVRAIARTHNASHSGGSDAAGSGAASGELDGRPVSFAYPVTTPFERRRALAAHMTESVFVYDFIELMQRALETEWDRYGRQAARAAAAARTGAGSVRRPRRMLVARELVLVPRRAGGAGAGGATSATGSAPASDPFGTELGGVSEASMARFAAVEGSDSPRNDPSGRAAGSRAAPARDASGANSQSSDVWAWDIEETSRPAGQNDIAMVAWRITFFTPECPEEAGGREMVVIANDITSSAGSFGVLEDALFFHASRLAREAGLPRIFLAANSGARIGLAEEVKARFRVAWSRADDATKGFRYLYLSPEDYAALGGDSDSADASASAGAGSSASGAGAGAQGSGSAGGAAPSGSSGAAAGGESRAAGASGASSGSTSGGDGLAASGGATGRRAPSVRCHLVVEDGEERWVLDDVIGKDDGLGVENLRGSGLIAGETSRSYRDNFTLTYVTGRSVGIGAYLVRLGQRTIQKRTAAPILLTGYQALNKLIGAEVYTSNEQLGGPKIMYHNGVTHQVVEDDLHGMAAVLRWLSYVPRSKGASLPFSPGTASIDPVDRTIGFVPRGEPYDPRHLIAGTTDSAADGADAGTAASSAAAAGTAAAASDPEASWTSGFFDRGSWTEALAGWARTVVVGRARLGGIPLGVIIAETRTVAATRPADPATPQSMETTVQQAGQVWFPDSAYKTAQAIRDFAAEELPLFIFANWRGFSGGQRDMFDEVLKFGSYIVDALTEYKQPVFVYIPPFGELRGGAWVVVDPTINEDVMEMYAAPEGRGGVLEPAGIASIKFKARDIREAAFRLDPAMQALAHAARAARASGDEAAAAKAEAEAEERLRRLSGVFTQISHHFADLHDRPGRMMAKGVIRNAVPWERARPFFYWRLRRRLAEFALRGRITAAAPQLSFAAAGHLLRSWHDSTATSRGSTGTGLWDQDLRVLQWLADSRDTLEARVAALRRDSIADRVLELGTTDSGAAIDGILALINRLPVDQREAVVGRLRREVLFGPMPGSAFGGGDPLLAGLPRP
ncbi:hypothetical protein FNF27_04518 [Cafeteria roenbergensis]|uniref:Uncharacterized protein n=2 Tax=Cafeteria roenbergensis TaxID=33653 RepID=A0A5A8EB26_CAFRO|nr:hypothetical protein FNF27_04518 [Cafeteria roenbergensis]